MLRILIGKNWTVLRDEILKRIAANVRKQQGNRILMVPELISHDAERRLCLAAGDTVSRFAEVVSFTRLYSRVADLAGGAAEECLDNGGRIVAMAAAADSLRSRLKVYAAVQTKPEFLLSLVETMDEMKRCCISPKDLAIAAEQTEGLLAQKLSELSELFGAYEALCHQGRRDPRDQMDLLLELLRETDYAQTHVFYIDGFPDFSRQHLEILEYLIQESPCVTVSLPCDRPDSRRMAFEEAGATAGALLRCARQKEIPVEVETLAAPDRDLQKMCEALFQGPLPALSTKDLAVLRADSVTHEIQILAERIRALVQQGCRYRQISVVCADPGGYQDLLRQTFARFGIPLYLAGTEDVIRRTVIAALLSAMEAALGGFDREDVIRYLRSLLSPMDPEICDRVENYAILWGIRGKRWLEPWTAHPAGKLEAPGAPEQALLEQLNLAKDQALKPLAALRQGVSEAKNVAGQVQALSQFLEDIQLATHLERLAGQMEAEGDLRDAQILNQMWRIIVTAMEQLYDVLGQALRTPEAFVRLFALLLRQYDVGTIPTVLDAVTAGPCAAMRCQQADHLFVLGASEGNLPHYGTGGGLLSEQDRSALRKLGIPLTGGAMEGLQTEFSQVYGVFCGAEKTVTVSYPGGQASYVCRRVMEMAGGEQASAPKFGPALTDPQEAATFLAARGAQEDAKALGLEKSYLRTREKMAHRLGAVSPEGVSALYGGTLRLSASQLEQFAQCSMAYFLKYGMGAAELQEVTVDQRRIGTYFHAVLERTARQVMARGGFSAVSQEEILEIAENQARAYRAEAFSGLDSARIAYLLERNQGELAMIVTELWEELRASAFAPVAFELKFGSGGLAPIEIPGQRLNARLTGVIDRVDLWQDGSNRCYRVVDYKTGAKDLDLCDLSVGVGLQMLLYLFALQQSGQALLGEAPIPVGVQYFPARMEVLSAKNKLSPEQVAAEREKKLERKGMVLDEPAVQKAMFPEEGSFRATKQRADRKQFQALKGFVMDLLRQSVDAIASGDVTPNPYARGRDQSACKFCPYGSVCRKTNGVQERNYRKITQEEFWKLVEEGKANG